MVILKITLFLKEYKNNKKVTFNITRTKNTLIYA
jgi:hypothetical protein